MLAGPGTGKTTTIVEGVAAYIDDGVPADGVLVLTFSRRAAIDLRRRIAERLGRSVVTPRAMTFHAFCVRVLRREAELMGYSSSFSIYDEDDRKKMLASVIAGLDIDAKRFPVSTSMSSFFAEEMRPTNVETGNRLASMSSPAMTEASIFLRSSSS